MKNLMKVPFCFGLMALGALGCRDHSATDKSSGPVGRPGEGKVTLTVRNGGFGGSLKELKLEVVGVDLSRDGSAWIALPMGASARTLDLLEASPRPLVEAALLPAGEYRTARIRLGTHHSVRDDRGPAEGFAPETLTVSSNLTVVTGGVARFTFLYDGSQGAGRGPSGAWVFRPGPAQVRDQDRTGIFIGTLRDKVTKAPSPGPW
jgi:hypothetical protein